MLSLTRIVTLSIVIVLLYFIVILVQVTFTEPLKSNPIRVPVNLRKAAPKNIIGVKPNNNIATASTVTSMATVTTDSMSIPPFLYGTAWKKEKTQEYVYLAVKTGFRGIDTACQPKHYNESGVGAALQQLYAENIVTREQLFLQTKYTSVSGQDPTNIPYDSDKPLDIQVQQSLQVSLNNLHTTYLDSLVLHSPMKTVEETMTVWREFEKFVDAGLVKKIGISNCYHLELLQQIFDEARIKPSFLQNRFYDHTNHDVDIRKYCIENNIQYQSFWTLTANPKIVHSRKIQQIAEKYNKTPEQVYFRYVKSLNIVILSGTKSEKHMLEDLTVMDINLEDSEYEAISKLF